MQNDYDSITKANRRYLIIILISLFASSIISLLYVFVTRLLVIIGSDTAAFSKFHTDLWSNTIFKIVFSQLILACPIYLYLIKNKMDMKKILRFNKLSFSNLFLILLLTVTISPVMDFLNILSLMFVDNTIQKTINGLYDYPLFISLFVVAGLPCFFEETVYRGFFFSHHRRYGITKAVLMSGLLFGAMHMNINQFAYAFAMGIVFALVVEITDSIFSSMIMHFLINGKSIVLSYILKKSSLFQSEEIAKQTEQINNNGISWGIVGIYAVIAVFALGISIALLYCIATNNKKEHIIKGFFKRNNTHTDDIYEEKPKGHMITTSLVAGVLFCFIYMIALALT